jgi:hypothetical protein
MCGWKHIILAKITHAVSDRAYSDIGEVVVSPRHPLESLSVSESTLHKATGGESLGETTVLPFRAGGLANQ